MSPARCLVPASVLCECCAGIRVDADRLVCRRCGATFASLVPLDCLGELADAGRQVLTRCVDGSLTLRPAYSVRPSEVWLPTAADLTAEDWSTQ